jgi:hypothetical protein
MQSLSALGNLLREFFYLIARNICFWPPDHFKFELPIGIKRIKLELNLKLNEYSIRSEPFLIIWVLFSICFVTGCRKSVDNEEFKEPKWNLIFQDGFNDYTLHRSAWSTYTSIGQEGNGLRRPEAFSLRDGTLAVTAAMIDRNLVSS